MKKANENHSLVRAGLSWVALGLALSTGGCDLAGLPGSIACRDGASLSIRGFELCVQRSETAERCPAAMPEAFVVGDVTVCSETPELTGAEVDAAASEGRRILDDNGGHGELEPGDDKGGHGELEPWDDKGGHGELEPGDDKGGHGELEPGDDKGGHGELEPGDDKGGHGELEPWDDNGGHGELEPGDDNGGHGELEPGDDDGGHGELEDEHEGKGGKDD